MGTIQICETCWSRQNSQLAGQILFCPGVSAGHIQKLFQALHLYILLYRRLDYSVISHGLMDHVIQVYGSDHCPIVLLITL